MSGRIRLQIDQRTLLAQGMAFGASGAYERLSGTVHFAVDPHAPAYRAVVDLEHVFTNAAGEVEFSADFCLLKPVDPTRGNRRILSKHDARSLEFALCHKSWFSK